MNTAFCRAYSCASYFFDAALQDKWNPIAVAFLVVAGVCFVPVIFLPAGPFIWLAAASLGVWKGFLVVQLGTVLGMTLSYFLGKRLLRKRIRRCGPSTLPPKIMTSSLVGSLDQQDCW